MSCFILYLYDLKTTCTLQSIRIPQSYLQYTEMHYGWWLCQHCSGPRRRRHPRVTDLDFLLLHSGRRGSPLAKPVAPNVHLHSVFSEAGHFSATQWLLSGCHLPGRRAWRDSQLSPQHQMGVGRCGVPCPLHELCKLRRRQICRKCKEHPSVYLVAEQ